MYEGDLRERLKNYVDTTGVKYTYICKKIDIHKSTMSHFIIRDRALSQKTLDKIYNYLFENNAL
ncbi:hypothetical protein HBE96_23435 [Clostridium sp. P21]|uniref:HTH cro/C1-type domain-containing protein n=1 Tax=Clostridium muellerianum TaxID=2716538 RepID=A0A7Y0HPX4_9CLOT|nr:hypothetical protein [Clostridium muellerianum]NMM65534.1 hypothetical protein [Clostridium muellerianum]